jgi:hypothetical protein
VKTRKLFCQLADERHRLSTKRISSDKIAKMMVSRVNIRDTTAYDCFFRLYWTDKMVRRSKVTVARVNNVNGTSNVSGRPAKKQRVENEIENVSVCQISHEWCPYL